MAVTGVGMIWAAGIDPFSVEYRWLLIAIAIYLAALAFALFVQRPKVKRIIELTGGHTGAPAPAPAGPNAAAGPPPGLM